MKEMYDVLIIGGGVVGSAMAREMSRYRLKIGVLEKNLDVCNETSGRNSGVVHGGFAYDRGSLKAKLCVEGNKMMGDLAKELDFHFIRCGKVLVGNTEEDMETLKRTMEQGKDNGATGLELIDEKRLHELVPAVVGKFAMFSHNSGIVDPFGYTIALAENAHANGVEYHFGCGICHMNSNIGVAWNRINRHRKKRSGALIQDNIISLGTDDAVAGDPQHIRDLAASKACAVYYPAGLKVSLGCGYFISIIIFSPDCSHFTAKM